MTRFVRVSLPDRVTLFDRVTLVVRRSLLLSFAACLFACQSEAEMKIPEADVGVFYGGQIQRVTSVELSTVAPPRFGFRVIFPPGDDEKPLSREVFYEIVKPGPAGRRVTEEGSLKLPLGQTQLDHVVQLPEEAKLGVWNIRVVWGETILADRAIYLLHPSG